MSGSMTHFKELILMRITTEMQEVASILVEQIESSLDRMRYHQGQIAGLKRAEEIINETYRTNG